MEREALSFASLFAQKVVLHSAAFQNGTFALNDFDLIATVSNVHDIQRRNFPSGGVHEKSGRSVMPAVRGYDGIC